jgi:DNA-binding NarL/FixJ family response regulator
MPNGSRSEILFLTQNNDAGLVRAVLSNGVQGYVLKAGAGSDLLPAIKAVLQGEKFVSSGINGTTLERPTIRKILLSGRIRGEP